MIAIASLAAALAALIFGILLGAGLQAGWSITEIAAGLNNWQTLIAALITVPLAAFGLLVTMRQLRINVASREEDRIERSLPGLEEAASFLARINNSLAAVHSVAYAGKEVLDAVCDAKPGETADAVVAKNISGANGNIQRRTSEVLVELYRRIAILRYSGERVRQAAEEFSLTEDVAAESHDKLRKEVDEARTAFDLAGLEARKILVRSRELESEFAAEIFRLEARLLKYRAEIES
jgi:hypothetical protein